MSLSRILQKRCAQFGQFPQMRGHSVKMNGHDRFRSRVAFPGGVAGIHREIIEPDVHEYRRRAKLSHGHGRGGGADRGDEDFITSPHPERSQANPQRIGPGCHPDSRGSSAEAGKLFLERLNRWSENIPSAGQHLRHRRINFG